MRLCEVPSGKELARFEGEFAALSPDGTRVAFHRDKRIVLRDIASGKDVGGFHTGVDGPFQGYRFTPNGRFLVTVGPATDVVRVWDVASGKVRSRITVPGVPDGGFVRFGLSPDSRRILCGSNPSTPATNPPIILWDIEAGREICRLGVRRMVSFPRSSRPTAATP